MKKILIILVGLLFLNNIHAQVLKFGFKGGVNFSNYSNGNIQGVDFKTITNFHAGIVTEIRIFENLALQPELLYSTQGSELNGFGEQIKNELGYLSVPVLAKFYLTNNGLSLEAGPQFSVLVSERNEINTDDSSTFDFGVAAGLSYKITNKLFISGRYIAGLSEVKRDAEVKNSVIQLSLGVLF